MTKANVIHKAVISEKSFKLAGAGQYTFVVNPNATAADIAHAIEALYGVTVVSVRTLNRIGKLTRYRGFAGQRNHTKKAIVRLASGQAIPGFELPTAEETPAEETKQVTTKVREPKRSRRVKSEEAK